MAIAFAVYALLRAGQWEERFDALLPRCLYVLDAPRAVVSLLPLERREELLAGDDMLYELELLDLCPTPRVAERLVAELAGDEDRLDKKETAQVVKILAGMGEVAEPFVARAVEKGKSPQHKTLVALLQKIQKGRAAPRARTRAR